MVDGSKVHKKLGWKYQPDYKRICEGVDSPEEIARSLVKLLAEDVRKYGPIPLDLLRTVAAMLQPIAEQPLLMTRRDWADIQQWIEQAAQRAQFDYAQENGDKYRTGIEAARLACEQQLTDARRGVAAQGGVGTLQAMLQKYLSNIHDMDFAGKVPGNREHYLGVDHDTVNSRLAAVEPFVQSAVPALARQLLDEHRDIRTVRAPARKGPKPGVDIDRILA